MIDKTNAEIISRNDAAEYKFSTRIIPIKLVKQISTY